LYQGAASAAPIGSNHSGFSRCYSAQTAAGAGGTSQHPRHRWSEAL